MAVIGKWNRSVILTYAGLGFAIAGIYLSFCAENLNYSMICLVAAGICDLFDGAVARKCKRTEEEKQFGIQLDSLVDVMSFLALPVTIFIKAGMQEIYHIIIIMFFGICAIARLAFFNITAEVKKEDKPISFYRGLPVTYTALIIPLCYAFLLYSKKEWILTAFTILVPGIGMLNILDIPIKKPGGVAYVIFAILAVAISIFLCCFSR